MTDGNPTQSPMGSRQERHQHGDADAFKVSETTVLGVDCFYTYAAYDKKENLPDDEKTQFYIKLHRWIYEQDKEGKRPEINIPKLNDILIEPMPSIPRRMEMLAVYMADEFPMTYHPIHINSGGKFGEVVIATCSHMDSDQIKYLVNGLVREGYAMFDNPGSDRVALTLHGHTWVEQLRHRYVPSEQVFVAMWFDTQMNAAYDEGIKLGIEDAGYKPLRIDRKEHANKIDDEIISEIRRSRFVVADFTSGVVDRKAFERGGVYYEAGFAHGLNIPVIFTCREDCVDYLHFDTRQFNHILWADNDLPALRKALSDRISNVVGDGPHRKRPAST